MNRRLALGIDVGTSGVRMVALDGDGSEVAHAAAAMAAPNRIGSSITQDAAVWWRAVEQAFAALAIRVDLAGIAAIAVDGTSGTLVAIDSSGKPIAPARMYNDLCSAEAVALIAKLAPAESAAHGATSALGRALQLQAFKPHRILHQADWIAGRLSSCFDTSDENNALKTGYDPIARRWPDWIGATGMNLRLLPLVLPAGAISAIGLSAEARAFGLSNATRVVAGTTDGCAAFLATGAVEPGDAVTSLGSTLVLKLLTDRPLFAPELGLYSHRIGDIWLAGGASNTGGAALLQHFPASQMLALELKLDPAHPTGLNFYPLPGVGERFPINDPRMTSSVAPRPANDAQFLQALLEGIAAVEALGYQRLGELGGPKLKSIRTVGGGSENSAWTEIRKRVLAVPFLASQSQQAAAGAARLALRALR